MPETIKIGSRGSELARVQTKPILEKLRSGLGFDCELVVIQTAGDLHPERPLREIEGQGFFTREIEEALLEKRIDVAVHSLKDLPTKLPKGLTIAAVTRREDPADVLLTSPDAAADDEKLPLVKGAVVGAGSARRQAQLVGRRPDLQLKDLRGNLTTRIEKLAAGKYQAIIVAAAGLNRLQPDLSAFLVHPLPVRWFVPTPGQGALAVQMRAGDQRIAVVRRTLHDDVTDRAVEMERKVLRYFGGGCGLPLGVLARPTQRGWEMFGFWQAEGERAVWSHVKDYRDRALIGIEK